MNCEKCRDRGFIELDKAGLQCQICDCEAGINYRAKILGLPKDDSLENSISPNGESEAMSDSSDRVQPVDTDLGSGDIGVTKTIKPKKSKRSRKRA